MLYHGEPVCLDGMKFPCPATTSSEEDRIAIVAQQLFGTDCTANYWVEGVFNKLYGIDLGIGRAAGLPESVICRISKPRKVDSDIDFGSEVATMLFVAEQTAIPIPKVYAYCTETDHLLGSSYMFIEHIVNGDTIIGSWEELDHASKERTVRDYANIVCQLSRLRFDKIGSLHFKPGGGYEVGRLSRSGSCRAARSTLASYQASLGPFDSAESWLTAIERNEIEFIETYPDVAVDDLGPDWAEDIPHARSVLPRTLDKIAEACKNDALGKTFCLWHTDMTSWNIIVSTTGPESGRITAIIDWEMAGTFPLWSIMKPPNFFVTAGLMDQRPKEETQRFQALFEQEIRAHDQDGSLTRAFDGQSVHRRKLAEAVSICWLGTEMREEWLAEHDVQGRKVGRKATCVSIG